MSRNLYFSVFSTLVFLPLSLVAAPLFDAHLHYNMSDARVYSPQDIVSKLDKNQVQYAAVTGIPASNVMALYKQAPNRIIPILSLYDRYGDKESWVNKPDLPMRIATKLKQGRWCGIGELHLFAKYRQHPVFKRIVALSAEKKLPLLIHADPAVIDTVYDIAPQQVVIWAHGGTFAYPDLIASYLRRYPTLYIDVSMRDRRIAPNHQLDDAWYELFVSYPDRVMVGVDTFSTSRWDRYDKAVSVIRHWLSQLPQGIAEKIAYTNAKTVFEACIKE